MPAYYPNLKCSNTSGPGNQMMMSGSTPCSCLRLPRIRSLLRSRMKKGATMIKKLLSVMILSLYLGPVWAGEALEPVSWDALSTDEQQVLSRFEFRWNDFAALKQKRLQKGAQRWQTMTSEEQDRFKKRFQRWKKLSPDTRKKIKERYIRYQKLPPEKQAAIRARHEWFRKLEPEQRARYRKKWQSMDRDEKRKFLKNLRDRERQANNRKNQRRQRPATNH